MATLFTNLIENDLAAFVYQDDVCVSFLDIRPAAPGHCLVVPRAEVDEWTDLEPETAAHLTTVAQKIAAAQKKVFVPKRVGLMIAGFEVPHCHIHVIPINSMSDFEFGSQEASAEKLNEHQQLLVEALETL